MPLFLSFAFHHAADTAFAFADSWPAPIFSSPPLAAELFFAAFDIFARLFH